MTVPSDAPLTREEFVALAARAGLKLKPEEIDRMFEGYENLQLMLARIPDAPPMFDEPATVFLGSGGRIVS